MAMRFLVLLPFAFLLSPPAHALSLREAADRAGMQVGSAVGSGFLQSDPLYAPTLAAEFNSVTAENEMKWPQIHPQADVYRFGPADEIVAFAAEHDMAVRGHTLIWANPIRIPGYVNEATTTPQLQGYMDDHISTVVGRYAGVIDAWDVVNEPFQSTNTETWNNVFEQLIGPDYIAQAFRLAHEADPDATLFLNEVLIDFGGDKFDVFRDLVVDLLDQDVPIHGVGFQMHLLHPFSLNDAEVFRESLRTFADLGLAVEITEMDVALITKEADRLEAQRRIYQEIVGACVQEAACPRVTFWGFTDAHTWIDGTLGPGLDPLLLDELYREKPAYFGVRDALVPEPGTPILLVAAATVAARSRPLRNRDRRQT